MTETSNIYDAIVIGAGFAGAVMAERLASDGDRRVLIVDRRTHIAGNAFDCLDPSGVLIHAYGPHIFHTNNNEIVDYLTRFTAWRLYEHRVLANVGGMNVPIPVNRTTLNMIFGVDLRSEADAEAFLATKVERFPVIENAEQVVVSAVGRELYQILFQNYTKKQWGIDPDRLDKSVTARIPTRFSTDDRYFSDSFQAMPADGYTHMFERMLAHPKIDILLGTDFSSAKNEYKYGHTVFTGAIDEYFNYSLGRLPYRSLRFHHKSFNKEWFQKVGVVNYPSEEVDHTRITEYKHITGQRNINTSVSYEYPSDVGDPYYPIPSKQNLELYRKYKDLARSKMDVTFVGRLGTYQYYNMDQVVGQALATYRRKFSNVQHNK